MKKVMKMGKKSLSFLLAMIMFITILPQNLKITAEEESYSAPEMEVGVLYNARWDYSQNIDTYLYKEAEDGGMIKLNPPVMKDYLPQTLTVKMVEEDDFYVYVTNEDWPAEFERYRYVELWELIILGKCYPDNDEDKPIEGEVDIVADGNAVSTLTVNPGEKKHVFTRLGEKIGNSAKYQWQLKIDTDAWANIQDYIYPYAVISEALIANAKDEDGYAYVRCMVTDGETKYVSQEMAVCEKKNAVSVTTDMAMSGNDGISLAAEGDGSSTNAFEIKIVYQFLHETLPEGIDLGIPADAFTITLGQGGFFTGDIYSFPVVGYMPYRDWDEAKDGPWDSIAESNKKEYGGKKLVPADFYHFENQNDPTTITVYYVPKDVSYRVKYFIQNLHDDGYTEWKTLNLKGTADTYIGAGFNPYTLDMTDDQKTAWTTLYNADTLLNDLMGFKPLAYDETTRITSDGGMVVEIYYDRIYYLVNYEMGTEAYGAMPNFVRYGTKIMLPDPTNPGYTFDGWALKSVMNSKINDKGETEMDSENNLLNDPNLSFPEYENATEANTQITVAHNLVYTANWKPATTSYTIIYWLENADDDNFTMDSVKIVEGVAPNITVSAQDDLVRSDKSCFTFNSARSDKDVIVKGDGTTAVNVYYNRNYINLIFKGVGNCAYTHTHGDGTCVAPLICGIENTHVHDASCGVGVLKCTIEVHTHDEECKESCPIKEHTAHTVDCINCNIATHQVHSASCYEGAGNIANDTRQNQVEGTKSEGEIGRYRRSFLSSYTYYIYINGSWYEYTGSVQYGNDPAEPKANCQLTHAHTNSCYKDSLHTHSELCCGKPAHTHDSNKCYSYDCGVVQHEHTDSCYGECAKLVHTHTNASNCSSKYVKVVTKKYDAYIADIWPIVDDNGYEYKDSGWWKSSVTSKYYTILQKMPNQDITMTFEGASGSTYEWYYALEKLPGATYEGKDSVTNNNKEYFIDFSATVKGNGISLTYDEDYFPITGFTQRDKNVPGFTNRIAYLYYTRNSYHLRFHDGTNEITSKTESILYEADISGKYFIPDIPSNKEAGSVKFVGWYTTQNCADGTEFNFSGKIMPARDLTLYAKWEPTEWNVEVYFDEEKTILMPNMPSTVFFGDRITPEPDYKAEQLKHPEYAPLIFAGWYYTDENGKDVRFDFNTMAIKRDYTGENAIFAKWISDVLVEYKVRYVISDGNGGWIDIADSSTGVSLAGLVKSFTAKVGNELYDTYRVQYLPNVRAISQEISTDVTQNEIRFVYTKVDEITYTIKHVFNSDSITNPDHCEVSWTETIHGNNITGKVSWNFISELETEVRKLGGESLWNIVKTLSPDAYTQELILVSQPTEEMANEIVFNWANRGLVFYYQVIHYFKNLDGTYATHSDELIGTYEGDSATITATPMNERGFKCVTAESARTKTFKKTDDIQIPKIIEIYYDRVDCEYEIRYQYGDNQIAESKTGTVPFETVLTPKAPIIEGYVIDKTKYQEDAEGNFTQSVTINDTTDKKIIVFYYNASIVTYNYQIAGYVAGAELSVYQERVKIMVEAAKGSAPKVKDGYVFLGWYTDKDCNTKVEDSWVDQSTNRLTPVPDISEADQNITFYAKIEPTSLTIQNAFAENWTGLDNGEQGFIYVIEGKDGTATEGISLRVAVVGDSSRTVLALPNGSYTITLESEWSWRYKDAFANGVIKDSATWYFDGDETVTVTYAQPNVDVVDENYYYITDNAACPNPADNSANS